MLKSRTLFVVGAGASSEVGFPLGLELKQSIASILDIKFRNGLQQYSGSFSIAQALREISRSGELKGDINPLLHASWLIRDAMPQALSIDNFLEAHAADERVVKCGKLGIAEAILSAEKKSLLFVDMSKGLDAGFNQTPVSQTWYSKLFQRLHERLAKGDVERIFDQVSFITFNYDRSLEQYLYHSLRNYYALSAEVSRKIMKTVKIFHPYGVCGALPWEMPEKNIPYGGGLEARSLLEISSQIRTFTERVEDEAALAAIRAEVDMAEVAVFLGFAYHEQNMELMQGNGGKPGARVYATALGISNTDSEIVDRQILRMLHRPDDRVYREIRNDLTCAALFDNYWRALAQ